MLNIFDGICDCGCHTFANPILHFADCCNGKCDICGRYTTISMEAHKHCCHTANNFLIRIYNQKSTIEDVVAEFDFILLKQRDFLLLDTIFFLAKPELLGPTITNLFLDLTYKYRGLLYNRGKFIDSIPTNISSTIPNTADI